jgi:hypothetical protein
LTFPWQVPALQDALDNTDITPVSNVTRSSDSVSPRDFVSACEGEAVAAMAQTQLIAIANARNVRKVRRQGGIGSVLRIAMEPS